MSRHNPPLGHFRLCAAAAAVSLIALGATGARAGDLIQFDDSGENVRILLNGIAISGATGPISNFAISPLAGPAGDPGELVTFDYQAPVGSPVLYDGATIGPPYIYTQLYEPGPAGVQIVSDEFGIRPILNALGQPSGGFNVAFTSADMAWIPTQFPGVLLQPSPLSALEVNGYQNVGHIMVITGAGATGSNVATFQVNSVPEPQAWLMLVAGLGVLGLARRVRG